MEWASSALSLRGWLALGLAREMSPYGSRGLAGARKHMGCLLRV